MNEASNESAATAKPGRGRRKHSLDAHAEAIPQGRSATMSTEAGVPVTYEESIIQVEHVLNTEKAAMLAFLEEPVDVLVHESTDKNAEPVIPLSINGVMQPIWRGIVTKVKRKYVAQLASLKTTTYTQKIAQDIEGNVTQKMVPHTALRFPFSVAYDANPLGVDWLRAQLNRR